MSSRASASTQGTPSNSSVKPLDLRKPAESRVLEARLWEVAALSLRPADLSALETLLRAEMELHLQAAAFSDDSEERAQHRGVVRWIRDWVNGATLEKYAEQARQRLGSVDDPTHPQDGSPWMESDGSE